MSKNKTKRSLDLIEDITVEELRKDGLVEEVAVSDGTPSKKDEKDAATDAVQANAATKASIDASASKDADKEAHVGSGPGTVETPDEVNKAKAATDAAIAAAPVAEPPKTKAGLINAVYQQLATMKTEELSNVYATLVNPALPPQAQEPTPMQTGDDSAEKDGEKEQDAAPAAPATPTGDAGEADDAGEDEDEGDDAEDKTTKESLEVLMQAEKSLSEGFRSKATELFESTVKAKVAAEVTKIEESYKARLDEEVATATKDLAEKVESYLDYVVKTWMEENKVAIESGLRTEIAENFINSLKSVFVESYIEVPEGKENLVDSLNTEVAKLEEQLLKSTEANIKLNESVNELLRKQVIAEASSDLASTEAVKLNSLVEDVDFENTETFSKKVQTIKESYFRKPASPKTAVETAMTLSEDSQPEVEMSPLIAAVSSAISRTLKP
jgi:hypothetical protein